MRPSARARDTHTHVYTHIHREVHGALFVQTINDVAQGHHAQFAQISIVIIIIIVVIERLFRGRKRDVHHVYVRITSLRRVQRERENERVRVRA
jgi:hypothetical protein